MKKHTTGFREQIIVADKAILHLTDGQAGTQFPVLHLQGFWREENCLKNLPELHLPAEGKLSFDCRQLADWDSSLLLFLRWFLRQLGARGLQWDESGLPAGVQRLLQLSHASLPPDEGNLVEERNFVQSIGEWCWDIIRISHNILAFTGELTLTALKMLLGRTRFQARDVIQQLAIAGPSALAIISLIGFLMGVILAFIGAIPLKWFNGEIYVASLIGIGILRLMAPVMVGVVMAGRTGAAYAAELGTMQTNEEIDAYVTMGIPPMEFLVLPRCLALTLMLPFLCLFADLMGIAGGMLVGIYYLNLTFLEFYQQLIRTTKVADLTVGLFTCLVFGVLVSACGCYQGLYCSRSAEGVGKAATEAVVNSIVCIVLATAVITIVTVMVKI